MKRACYLILLCLLLTGTSYAFDISGLQPVSPNSVFSTFSADSLPRQKISLEAGFERAERPDFYRFALKGAYGITDSMEFNFTIPYVYHLSDSIDGMEDIALGFKHRFYDEGKYGPSLAYVLSVSIPTGRDELSTNGRFGGGFIITKRVGPFKGHLNVFYEKPGTGSLQKELSFLGGIEFSASHNFKLLGEFIAQKSHFSNKYDRIEARFGYRIRTADFIYTTLGAGFDLKRRSPAIRILASVSFTFPREKREIKKFYEEE
jgi:hypothetical protein